VNMTSKRNASLQSPVFEHEATDRKDRHSIKNEIECPHCFDTMTLSSDSDSLSYVCEECGFTLYTTRLAT
jgi:DNA-directed RNA polymerase subunit RPC12/RpoP